MCKEHSQEWCIAQLLDARKNRQIIVNLAKSWLVATSRDKSIKNVFISFTHFEAKFLKIMGFIKLDF